MDKEKVLGTIKSATRTPLGINVLPDDAFLFAFQVPSRHLLAYSY